MGNFTSSKFELRYTRRGIVQPTGPAVIEVAMGIPNREEVMTTTRDHLWTQNASHCTIVCTYTPSTKVRSMTHLQGGTLTNNFYAELAAFVESNSTIVIASGGDWLRPAWDATYFPDFRDKIKQGIERQQGGISIPLRNFVNVFSPAVYLSESGAAGFVFKKSGRYGVLNPKGFGSKST
jgi:hypothetical protein